jgi:predicted AAA+ superfamily ATPase
MECKDWDLKLENIPALQSFFLFGPLQSGKSTMINRYLKAIDQPYLVYDLLKSKTFLTYSNNPDMMRDEITFKLKGIKKGEILNVFIDEIPKITILLDEVHSLIEEYKGKIRFILSGSSARKLKKEGANLLAGRAIELFLYPFSLLETGSESIHLSWHVKYGFIPAVITNYETPEIAADILYTYVDTYLKEEVRAEAIVRNISAFSKFLELAASENAQRTNYKNISRETGVSEKTTAQYYQILEDTLIGKKLYPYKKSLRKQLIESPKFYFFDNGIVNALTNIIDVDISKVPRLYGTLFESLVINEVLKVGYNSRKHWKYYFYATKGGVEVDLIIEKNPFEILAIEIKSSKKIIKQHFRGLKSFADSLPNNIKIKSFLVTDIERPFMSGDIEALPLNEMLKKISGM